MSSALKEAGTYKITMDTTSAGRSLKGKGQADVSSTPPKAQMAMGQGASGIETITIAAGTFSAYKFVSTTTWTVNGITRTESATRWRDASGGDTRTLKMVRAIAYSGGTPAAGSLVTGSRELQSYR